MIWLRYHGKPVMMPKFDTIMSKGIVVEWFRKEGDKIAEGEALLQMETLKAILEIEAPVSGIV